jgi:hypothetical protein
MKKIFALIYLLLSCLIPAQVTAQSDASTLVEKHYGNVAYISGGIGDEERDEIRLRERDFNVKLLFSEHDGAYLGNVDVAILNPKGETVFQAKSTGPFLLLQLPGGNYVINASTNGQLQQRKVLINGKTRYEGVFRW